MKDFYCDGVLHTVCVLEKGGNRLVSMEVGVNLFTLPKHANTKLYLS